jgi:hypothetical protein
MSARHALLRCAFVVLAAFAAGARAETFTVTRADDPAPDGCRPGDCSLREAVEAVAANDPLGQTDLIVLPAGTISLSVSRGTLQVAQPLRVQGAGADDTLIESVQGSLTLFSVGDGGDLTLTGLGLKTLPTGNVGLPFSIEALAGSRLTMDDVLVEKGQVTIYAAAAQIRRSRLRDLLIVSGGQLLVEDSAIAYLDEALDTSNVTLRRVALDHWLDPEPPQGVSANVYIFAGTLTIEDSTITHGSVYIAAPATLTLRRVRYLDNTGPIRSEAAANVAIEDSLFENNTARALYAAGGAEWNVTGSSFVKNRVDGNAGGAILLEDDTVLRIRNSTFSGNTFSVAAAADGARGAAIGYRHGAGAHLIVMHSTIAAPAVMPAGTVGGAIGGHDGNVVVDISNSIVRGSCGMDAHVLQNNSNDIESPGNTCGLDVEQNYVSVSSTSLALNPLANNGGPTPTILPGAGSLAINRAGTPQCLPTDQRGYARPGGARCDIGAVEADVDDTLFADGFD